MTSLEGRTRRRPIRILLCKPGLDGHDRGVKVVARALRDAGMEVIYLGMRLTADQVASAAIQEDVDVVGVSNHSAALPELCQQVIDLLRDRGGDDIPVIAGGTLLREDVDRLREAGVAAAFGPGTHTDRIVACIEGLVDAGANGGRGHG